jgi:IS5 family transposase
MIEPMYEEAFSPEWVSAQITDDMNELVILRQVIPWQSIINRLIQFYDRNEGRIGKSLRIMVALLILSRLRQLSDRTVVSQVKENRYLQYFCNVPDEKLANFVNSSSLCKFRKRLGAEGIAIIEDEVFSRLRQAGIVNGDTLLMDSTVLTNNIIYPNDVLLVYKAFLKIQAFAKKHSLTLWWDHAHIKKRWRAFGLAKKEERATYLAEFYLLFVSALATFRTHLAVLTFSEPEKAFSQGLLEVLSLLEMQTQQKLSGKRHIDNRIVSLDEIDARPIKKGKTYPACEFGTTVQMSFNRQGFMITTENFIGNPADNTLYGNTLQLYEQRTQMYPDTVVTDLGFRSKDNFKSTPSEIESVFLGNSGDVVEQKKDFCRKARSATEGFIAVAKNLRGFSKSLYRRFYGDKIWTLLCQTAYNLRKFLQLYRNGEIKEQSQIYLGLLA